MAYADKYDVPIKSIEYIDLDVTDPSRFEVVVTFLDETVERFSGDEKVRFGEIHRQLIDQQQAIMAGEKLAVIEPKVPAAYNAQVWSDEFFRMVIHRYVDVDRDLMTTWFANAIERGYIEGYRVAKEEYDRPVVKENGGCFVDILSRTHFCG